MKKINTNKCNDGIYLLIDGNIYFQLFESDFYCYIVMNLHIFPFFMNLVSSSGNKCIGTTASCN